MFNSSIENKKSDRNTPAKPKSILVQEAFLLENSFYLSGCPTLFTTTNSKNKAPIKESSSFTNSNGYSKNT